MADVRITQYPQKIVIADDDIFLIADSNDVDVNGFLKYKKVKAKDLPSIVNTAENITYANLIGLMAANGLITSTFYRITNSTSGVSPLLVQAVSNSTISYQAFDGANPLNTINYDVTTDTIRWNSNQSVAPVPSTRTITAGTGLTGGGDLTANRTFAIDSTVATLTGTQTLTNKTITSPVINEILDSNGNEILGFTPIASATDYITIKNGIGVGVPVHISAAGSSANTGLHLEPKGTGLVQISDGTDTTKGFRFRSSGSAASAVTLLDAVSSAGRVITLPDATTTLVGTNTTDTLTNKSISGATNTLSNIGNASLTNSAITINGTSTSLGGSINVGTVTGTGTTNYLPKFTGASALGNSLLQEGTSAIGLGVTPLAWNASFKALQIGTKTALWDTGGATQLSYNAYNDGANKYLTTGLAMRYFIADAGHTWSTAPSGTAGNALTFTAAMTLDANGQLGLGVTPSAWSGFNALQTVGGSVIGAAGQLDFWQNAYFDGASKYYATGTATRYGMTAGQHRWYNAISGSANTALTWVQTMTLDALGNLGIATATPNSAFKLDVVGNARVQSYLNYAVAGATYYRAGCLANANFEIYNTNLARQDFQIVQSTGAASFGGTLSSGAFTSTVATAGTSVIGFFNNTDFTAANKSAIRVRQQTGASTGFSAYLGMDGNTLFLSNDTTATNHLAISTTGAAAFSAGVSLSGATAPASGIQFPATQVASASANNLDDYEEGTWTMGVSFGGASVGVTYGANTGNYTKIGRQVTVVGYLVMTSKGTSIGDAKITGLPFTTLASLQQLSACSLSFANITFLNQLSGSNDTNATTISLVETSSLGVVTNITNADFANNSVIVVTLTYNV